MTKTDYKLTYNKILRIFIIGLFLPLLINQTMEKETKISNNSNINSKGKQKDWTKSLYLCLDIENKNDYYNKVIIQGLKLLLDSKSKDDRIEKHLEELKLLLDFVSNSVDKVTDKDPTYKFPLSLHITTYYRGKNKYDPNNQAYKEFISDEEVDVTIPGIIIIPNRIATAFAFTDEKTFINNSHPHITSVLGSYKPVDSNTVLTNLLSNDENLSKNYEKRFIDVIDTTVVIDELKLFDKKETAFIVLFGKGNERIIKSYRKARFN